MQKANNLKRLCLKGKNKPKNIYKYALYLEKWALDYLSKTSADGYCLGISGGIDSALAVAILSKLPNTKVLAAFIDIESDKKDAADAQACCKKFGVEYKYINLTKIYHQMVELLGLEKAKNAQINLKVRLRTLTIYALANRNNLLTCGTTNADERLVGYYTKFGDNACDISLLYWLMKSHIRYLAGEYEVPVSIINKQPSAGLYEGQTDEKDMGISYNEIDHYLSWAFIDPIQDSKITTRYVANKHKLNAPAKPKKFLNYRNSK